MQFLQYFQIATTFKRCKNYPCDNFELFQSLQPVDPTDDISLHILFKTVLEIKLSNGCQIIEEPIGEA